MRRAGGKSKYQMSSSSEESASEAYFEGGNTEEKKQSINGSIESWTSSGDSEYERAFRDPDQTPVSSSKTKEPLDSFSKVVDDLEYLKNEVRTADKVDEAAMKEESKKAKEEAKAKREVHSMERYE